jgi:hypothetical protein
LPRLPPDFERAADVPPLFFAADLVPDDLPVDVLLLALFEDDLDRERELPDDPRFDVDEDDRPPLVFAREPPLDLDDAVLLAPVELDFARPLPLAFFPDEFFVLDDPPDDLFLRASLDFVPELELFDADDDLRVEVDPVPLERPPLEEAAVFRAGAIVSAAAPTAPTAAPVAAPARISPATSITLFTTLDVVVRVEREELVFEPPVRFFDDDDDDVFAICFLPKMFVNKVKYPVISS